MSINTFECERKKKKKKHFVCYGTLHDDDDLRLMSKISSVRLYDPSTT